MTDPHPDPAAPEGEAFVDPLAAEDGLDDTSLSLWEGDEGALRLEVRQCLVVLLKRHLITSEKQPAEWATLLAHTRLVTSRLNDLFLDLVIDRDREVAYKVQVRHTVPGRFPPLLKDGAYSREETLLLVFLRTRYQADRAAGHDRVHVDRDECLDVIAQYRPPTSTDLAGDRKRASNAVDSLKTAGLLIKTSGDDSRLRISPVIETLLPLPTLKTLAAWMLEQNRPDPTPTEDLDTVPGSDTDEETAA